MPAATETAPGLAPLETHEHIVASAMAHKAGELAVEAVVNPEAQAEEKRSLTQEQYDMLVVDFANDPKEALGWAREALLAISSDERLTLEEREQQLDAHMDAYLSLTLKLDHQAFPATEPGEVRKSVVDYVPDGFNDMGRERSLNPKMRENREMIHVDKKALFDRYRPLLKKVFSKDYTDMTPEQKKKSMLAALAYGVREQLPTDRKILEQMDGQKVDLATLNEGVCRHQALTFQVLAQAAGLKTEIIKAKAQFGDRPPESHVANIVRIEGQWYILDVTNPDGVDLEEDINRPWKPGIIRIDHPPAEEGNTVYEGETPVGHQHRKYDVHNNAYWTVDSMAA